MTAQVITVPAGTRCTPFAVAPNAQVTVTPAAGATATVEYATGTAQDVQNNVATWLAWPYGPVGSERKDTAQTDLFVRVTATGAAVGVTVDDQPLELARQIRADWATEVLPPPGRDNLAVLMGDSIALNNWPSSTATFVSISLEGLHEWANAILGRRFNIVGNTGIGGWTAEQILTQLPAVLAFQPKYVFLSAGTNDLYNVPRQTGLVTFQRVQRIIQALLDAGVTPIWSTILPRTFVSASILAEHLDCNDRLRLWAANNPCGIFWDGFRHMVDSTSTQCNPKSGFTYDTSPAIHPNNYGAFVLGRACAAAINSYVPTKQVFTYGAEDQTNATYGSNILVNPIFGTPGATAAANTTGNVPSGWVGNWLTRTGTGSAALAIVNVTDPDSGVVVAQALEATFSGTCNAGDEFRFQQTTGFASSLVVGQPMVAEGVMQLVTPANVDRLRILLLANSTEQTNWGTITNEGGKATLAQAMTVYARTRPITVANNSAAQLDYRIRFDGAGTNTVFRVWAPRVRRNLQPALI